MHESLHTRPLCSINVGQLYGIVILRQSNHRKRGPTARASSSYPPRQADVGVDAAQPGATKTNAGLSLNTGKVRMVGTGEVG